MDRATVHTEDEVVCTRGCMKVLDLIKESLDCFIDTPRGRVKISPEGSGLTQNGKDMCLRITVFYVPKRSNPCTMVAHNLFEKS